MPGAAPMKEPPDATARRRALLDQGSTLLVEAGAGTGKTSLMAGRVALLLAAAVPPREIVAITFTEAASSELRERIENYVLQLAEGAIPRELTIAIPDGLSPEQTKNICAAAAQLDELVCTTIHGFCQQIVRAYPVEAGIDPGAEIIDPDAGELAYQDLLFAWLSARFGRDRSAEGLGRLPAVPEMGEDDFFAELMIDEPDSIVAMVQSTALFLRGKRAAGAPNSVLNAASLQTLSAAIKAFADWYAACGVIEEVTSASIADLSEFGETLAAAAAQPLSGRAIARLLLHTPPECVHGTESRFTSWKNKGKWKAAAKAAGLGNPRGEQLNVEAQAHYDGCSGLYTSFVESVAGAAIARFVAEFEPLSKLYADYKRQAALLDFDDLLHHARELLVKDENVRRDLGKRFSRILVDEFQDTDPLQAEILWLLCGEGDPAGDWTRRTIRPGTLFVVGDPKQAIYRFRGADVDTYLSAKKALLAQSADAVLEIVANFRSLRPIIDFANQQFGPLLSEELGQPGFTELAATREVSDERPRVACIDIAITDDHKPNGKLVVDLLRRAEASRIADVVTGLIGRYKVWDKHLKAERPCRAGDIALLAPTGTGLWMYERELETRQIAVASQAGKSFYTRQEVHDLIAIARAVSDRRDTLALGAFLRGPLVGLSEEELADVIVALPSTPGGHAARLHLWTDAATIGHPILKRALQVVQNLARKARQTTPYHLMAEAIEELNVRPILRDRYGQGAERALANVEMLLEMARAYDTRGIVAFAQALRENWEETERHIEGRPDADAEAVSIITMHSSKGLEWPVVIPINSTTAVEDRLAFLHRRTDNTLHFKLLGFAGPEYETVKSEEQGQSKRERVRLWYVALTRACDLLLLPRQSERVAKDWFSLLDADLAGLPAFDDSGLGDAVLATADDSENAQTEEIWKAEAAVLSAAAHTVIWRSPSMHEVAGGAAIEETVVPDATAIVDAVPEEFNSKLERSTIRGSRERGLVIHKLLEEVLTGETKDDLSAAEARARVLLSELGVPENNSAEEGPFAPEIAASVRRALDIDEIRALRPRLIPEVTVFAATSAGHETTYIGGVADAVAPVGDGRIDVVVDWKSDVDPDSDVLGQYRAQIRDYVGACGAKEGLLVFVTSGRIERVLPS
jgi:ATP-dependent exoDNAse (exonuclease V) beta subunit